MSEPEFSWTEDLAEALDDLEKLRTDLFIAGVDLDRLEELVEAVRLVDLQLVKARRTHRDEEFYPYYPEGYWAEVEGYEAAENLLRQPLPMRPVEGNT